MIGRTLSCILLSWFALAQPTVASTRAALIVDLWPQANSSSSRELADVLAEQHGFDVMLPTAANANFPEEIKRFASRARGSDLAFVVLVGPLEHDAEGTSILLNRPERGAASQLLGLTPLFEDLVRGSKAAVVVIQEVEKPASTPGRKPGPGRLPVIEGKLQIAFAPPVGGGSIVSALVAEAKLARERPTLDLQALVAGSRERQYLASLGQSVPLIFGSLPPNLDDKRPPSRSVVIEEVWERARTLCKADASKSRPKTEQKILSHFATDVDGLRTSALSDNDTFTLNRLLRRLEGEQSCPYIPPVAAIPPEEPKPKRDGEEGVQPGSGQPAPSASPAPDSPASGSKKETDDSRKQDDERKKKTDEPKRDREEPKKEADDSRKQDEEGKKKVDEPKREREEPKKQQKTPTKSARKDGGDDDEPRASRKAATPSRKEKESEPSRPAASQRSTPSSSSPRPIYIP